MRASIFYCSLCIFPIALLLICARPIQAGFSQGDDIGDSIQQGSTEYNLLTRAINDLAAVNPQAAKDLGLMLNNPEGFQLNVGLAVTNEGAQIDTSGGLTLADGQPGVAGDGININRDVLLGRQKDAEGHWSNTFDPDTPSTCNGSNWNNLVSVLAHEWVHASANAAEHPMPSANHSAITDYCWEKPAYEKQMEVLRALGEHDGFYPGPQGPTKTYLERLEQELARKRKAAIEEMWRKGFGGDFAIHPTGAGAGGCYYIGARNATGDPTTVIWTVDGNILYCIDPNENLGAALVLPFERALDFRPVLSLPRESEHTMLFIAGIREGMGVVLGIEIHEASVVRTALHLEIPGCEPWSLAYRGVDGSLWLLDGANQAIRTIVDSDGDYVPNTLASTPFATASEWPPLENAQQIVAYANHAGIGIMPVGHSPHDVLQLWQPLTFLTDNNGDGVADASVESVMGAQASLCPRFATNPDAGATACPVVGISGALVSLISCDATGHPTGETIGSVVISNDFTATMSLARPLAEGEYVLLNDPAHEIGHEATPYRVPSTGTRRPPVVTAPSWQMAWQTSPDGALLHFDASGTIDPDGDPMTFTWQWLQDSYSSAPTLGTGPTLDIVLPPGIHPIRLIVDDGVDAIWTYCYAGVLPNQMPVARTVATLFHFGTTVILDGSASTDADIGDVIVQYRWSSDDHPESAITSVSPSIQLDWEEVASLLGGGPLQIEHAYPLTLTVTDSHGGTGIAHTSVTITDIAPVASDQSVAMMQDGLVVLTLSATDFENDPLTYSVESYPAHGALSGSGASLAYTPATGYVGPDSFTFTASDGALSSNTATVTISVHAPLTGVQLLSDEHNILCLGNTQHFSAEPIGSIHPEYAFGVMLKDVKADGTYVMTTIVALPTSYTDANTFQFKPVIPGWYYVTVSCRENGTETTVATTLKYLVVDETLTKVVNVTTEKSTYVMHEDDIVRIHVEIAGTGDRVQYRYTCTLHDVAADGAISKVTVYDSDWCVGSSCVWQASSPGYFTVTATARDASCNVSCAASTCILVRAAELKGLSFSASPLSGAAMNVLPPGGITLTATPVGSGAGCQYFFAGARRTTAQDGSTTVEPITFSTDWGTSASFAWTPTDPGSYLFTVSARDATCNTTISKCMNYVLHLSKLKGIISLLSDPPSGILVSAVPAAGVTLTTIPDGAEATAQYFYTAKRRVYRTDGSYTDTPVTLSTAYQPDRTYAWHVTQPGMYLITVTVRDTIYSIVKRMTVSYLVKPDSLQGVQLSATPPSNTTDNALPAEGITMTAVPDGGGAGAHYSFTAKLIDVQPDGSVVVRPYALNAGWSSSPAISWLPPEPGSYTFTVIARDADNLVTFSRNLVYLLKTATVTGILSFASDIPGGITLAEVPPGGVHFTAEICGTGTGVLFCYQVGKSNGTSYVYEPAGGDTSSSTFTFTPSEAGVFRIWVYAFDATCNTSYAKYAGFVVK